MATDESTKQALVGREARGHSLAANLALACSLLATVVLPSNVERRYLLMRYAIWYDATLRYGIVIYHIYCKYYVCTVCVLCSILLPNPCEIYSIGIRIQLLLVSTLSAHACTMPHLTLIASLVHPCRLFV